METKTHSPNFTVSLRGYDREEVDEYLDSLTHSLGHVDDAEQHNRQLQAHVNQLNSRIKELEDRLSSNPPKSGAMLGERIGNLLQEAEKAAEEAVATAEARAAEIIVAADAKNAQAEAKVRQAVSLAEEQARRIEMAARGDAEEIISEAETRANVRTRQIEQWAEQVVSHTRAEEVRMLKEQQARQSAAAAELKAIADQKALAASTLVELRSAIDQALRLVAPDDTETEPEAKVEAVQPDGVEEQKLGERSVAADQPFLAGPTSKGQPALEAPSGTVEQRDEAVNGPGREAVEDGIGSDDLEAGGEADTEHGADVEDGTAVPADAFYPHVTAAGMSAAGMSAAGMSAAGMSAGMDDGDDPITSEIELRDVAMSASPDDVGFEDWISEGAKSGPQHFRRL